MAREINRLTSRGVTALKEPGLHADGSGLYLRIDQTLNKRWVWVYFWLGRRREMGLGSALTVDLKDARLLAATARQTLARGSDPIAARKAEAFGDLTFLALAERVIADMQESWRNPKTGKQWLASLKHHAKPILAKPVAAVDTAGVVACLSPIWQRLPETANRVRSRIEHILDVAKVEGLREGENPARWKGHLKHLLSREKRERGHHAAMSYESLPAFMAALRNRQATAALALEFAILTAARTTEVREARWSEIHGDVWIVPAERMKAGLEHHVPLPAAALAVLEKARPLRTRGDYLFPGDHRIYPLSRMAMAMLLRRMEVKGVTVHGFRSTFKDWAEDCTDFPDERSEEALAHVVGSKTKRAYRRRTALEKRRVMMDAWAEFCARPAGNVVQFPQQA